MKYDRLKQIDIVDWMNKNGYKQGKGRTGKWRSFYSPFTQESEPSFKVDVSQNKWVDFSVGITRKQSIIDLVMKIENCDFKTACVILEGNKSIEITHYEPKKQESGVKIHSVEGITDKELIHYFVDIRKINIDVLKRYCKELVISFPFSENKNRTYRVIGMENSLSGWDFRSTFLKMASAPKSFTKIKGRSSSKAILIEGFTDWLSYATYYEIDVPDYDVFILNGLGQLNVLKPFIEDREILFMLDNDKPADAALESLKGLNVHDLRHEFSFFKDFNSFLQSI